jgi:hypothetical protein
MYLALCESVLREVSSYVYILLPPQLLSTIVIHKVICIKGRVEKEVFS